MDHLQLRCPQCCVFRLPVLQLTVKLLHELSRPEVVQTPE